MGKKCINKRLDALEYNVIYLAEENMKNKVMIDNNPNKEEKRFRTIQRTVSRLQEEIAEKNKTIELLKKGTICHYL